jgi:hypothetical protein
MNLDLLVKYLIWIALFILLLGGLYLVLKKLGIM